MKMLMALFIVFNFAANARSRSYQANPRDVKKLCNDFLRENQSVVASGKGTCERVEFREIIQGQEQTFKCESSDLSIRYLDVPASGTQPGYKACTTEKISKWRDSTTISEVIKTIHTPFATMRVDQGQGEVSIELTNGQKVSYRYEDGVLDAREPNLVRPGEMPMPLKSLSELEIKQLLAGRRVKFKEWGRLKPIDEKESFGTFTDAFGLKAAEANR